MARVVVDVTVSQWGCSDLPEPVLLPGGRHVLTPVSAELLRKLAAAAAAGGAVVIVDADAAARKTLDKAVESDKASAAKLAKAIADGTWQESNLLAHQAAADADGEES